MRKKIKLLFLLILLISVFLTCACASKAPVSPVPEWGYEEKAIRLHLTGDSQLNLYEGRPHALILCIYQLRDPNAFNQLLEERDGIAKLLECSRFDSSVAASKKFVIQPGQEMSEVLDRAEGAKYIGVAAGYYAVQKGRAVRLLPIPVIEESKGFLGRTKIAKPGIVDIGLYLGSREIKELKGK